MSLLFMSSDVPEFTVTALAWSMLDGSAAEVATSSVPPPTVTDPVVLTELTVTTPVLCFVRLPVQLRWSKEELKPMLSIVPPFALTVTGRLGLVTAPVVRNVQVAELSTRVFVPLVPKAAEQATERVPLLRVTVPKELD